MPDNAVVTLIIYAKDLAAMAQFYREVLKCVTLAESATYTTLDCAGTRLMLHAVPEHIATTIQISNPPARRVNAAMKLSAPVATLSRARELAARYGGLLDTAASETDFDGLRYCTGVDPEGNVVQLHELIHS